MRITLATYNILHGYYAEQISENIKLLINKGVDVICIQEAELNFENFLPNDWQIEYYRTEQRGCRLGIAWDKSKLTLENTKTFLLPPLIRPSLLQRLTAYKAEKIQRGAFIANFLVEGKFVKVINTHLAWEGGKSQRMRQLKYLVSQLDDESDYEILAGDFNTNIPSLFRRNQERKIERILKGWINVLPKLSFTCDISHTDPQDGLEFLVKLHKIFGIKFRCRLDYIFSRDLKVLSKEMLDLPGSDHRPLMATFEV